MLAKAMGSSQVRLQRWAVPQRTLTAIDQLIDSPWQSALHNLLLEGVSLQVLALRAGWSGSRNRKGFPVSTRDRQLLERIRERLYHSPGEDHTLADGVVKLACMSPSTLRVKFQAVYQRSVFGWLVRRTQAGTGARVSGSGLERAAGGPFCGLSPCHQLRHGIP